MTMSEILSAGMEFDNVDAVWEFWYEYGKKMILKLDKIPKTKVKMASLD